MILTDGSGGSTKKVTVSHAEQLRRMFEEAEKALAEEIRELSAPKDAGETGGAANKAPPTAPSSGGTSSAPSTTGGPPIPTSPYKIEEKEGVPWIRLTQAELDDIARRMENAKCQADVRRLTPRTYKVVLRDGGFIFVDELNEDKAKEKATQAGYSVAWVTWSPPYEGPTRKKPEATEAETIILDDGSKGVRIADVDGMKAYQVTGPDGSVTTYVEIGDKPGRDTMLMAKSDWDSLSDELKNIAREKGWSALSYEMWAEKAVAREKLERELASGPEFLEEAYRKGGIEGYNKAVDDWNRVIEWIERNRYEMWPQGLTPEEQEERVQWQARDIYELYWKMMKPREISAEEYEKIKPFISPRFGGGVDVTRAIKANVPDATICAVAGITQEELNDAKWQAEFENAGWFKQQQMLLAKDSVAYIRSLATVAGEAAITMIPFYGTEYMAQRPDKYQGWEVGLSAASDALILVAGVGLVSRLVKTGVSLPRAIASVGFQVARGVVTTPWAVLRHPIATAKGIGSMVINPVRMLFSSKTLPLASLWRGSYDEAFSIPKVLAGSPEEALATQRAMAERFKLITEGKATSGVVEIKGFGELRFSATGLQKEMPNLTIHATPFGPQFKGVGVQIGREGLYVADQALLGLDQSSATGQSMVYVFRKKELLGIIDDTGNFLDSSGVVRGRLKLGEKLIDLRGKPIFRLADNAQVVDKTGNVVGMLMDGGVWTEDPSWIGKYYKGVEEYVDGAVGVINKEGMVEDATGKILGPARAKRVGYLTEGMRVVGENGVVVGKTKLQPTFVLIQTRGVSELPEYVRDAKNMKEMERRAWAAFRQGDKTGNLYPVFKQYAKWIEAEGFFPKDTRLIPVVKDNGEPLVLTVRDIGRKIELPVIQVVSEDWFEQSLELTKQVAKYPILLDDSVDVVRILEKGVTKVPRKSIKGIVGWLRQTKDAVVIGGASEAVFTKGKLTTADFDIAVPKPTRAMGEELAYIISRSSGKQTRVTVTSKNVIVEWLDKGLWRKAVDLDPLDWIKEKPPLGLPEFEYMSVGGINVQTPSAQLSRLLWDRMFKDFGGKGYQKWARYARALGADVDIGIGAVPPRWEALRKLQGRGAWNTLRDIFIPVLEKETWARGDKEKFLAAVGDIAPDLLPEARAAAQARERVERLLTEFRVAEHARTGGEQKALMRMGAKLLQAQNDWNGLRMELKDKLIRRVMVIDNVMRRFPGDDPHRMLWRIAETYQAMSGARTGIAERIAIGEARKDLQKLGKPGRHARPMRPEGVEVAKPRVPRAVEERTLERPGPRPPVAETSRARSPRVTPERPPRRPPAREEPDREFRRYGHRGHRYNEYRQYELDLYLHGGGGKGKTTKKRKATEEKRRKIPEGAITWRQGKLKRGGKLVDQWKYIKPPWTQEKPITLAGPPEGAVRTGERTPRETIQMIGEPRAKVPKDVSVDLGVVDIYVRDYGRRIEFKGGGEKTAVGKSLSEPTRGMSIPATGPIRLSPLRHGRNGRNRHTLGKAARTVSVA